GSSIVIPQNSKHRIKNTGSKMLRFVEVQTGDYFGEDDIKRYQDDYKRA
ncbi:mannose-1-phosphate guanylyltransferase/mannose-6-phosphate isomerase, partial [bacterium]|nr:mannose-1-phosphate guanylyltransferase/mannose-6-phosphate isomerase [bacterium]